MPTKQVQYLECLINRRCYGKHFFQSIKSLQMLQRLPLYDVQKEVKDPESKCCKDIKSSNNHQKYVLYETAFILYTDLKVLCGCCYEGSRRVICAAVMRRDSKLFARFQFLRRRVIRPQSFAILQKLLLRIDRRFKYAYCFHHQGDRSLRNVRQPRDYTAQYPRRI